MSTPSFTHSSVVRNMRLGRAPHALAVTVAIALALSGCGQKPETATPRPEVAAATPATPPSVCQASSSWITSPNPPSEIATAETFCDFYQFSWQWFLAQVSPSTTAPGERVFETNRLRDPSGGSGQCGKPKVSGRANAVKLLGIRDIKPVDFEEEQADSSALYDQNGNVLYYSVWYSDAECTSTGTSFAEGTMELKVAWKILPKADPTYFMMDAEVPMASGTDQLAPTKVILGLVGFHIVNWTKNHPEMIWASFEHKTNAPFCDGSSPMPASGWSLASSEAAQCLTANPNSNPGPPNAACAAFNFNTPTVQGNPPPPPTGTPNNICRQYPYGNAPGDMTGPNDNKANLAAIKELNAQLVGADGLLTKLGDDDPMAVWKNYEMIGALWTKDGQDSGVQANQRGSLYLANMTMESFFESNTQNCFTCHNFSTTDQPDVSHICGDLFTVDKAGNCQLPPPAAAAPAKP